ncbi:MAG: response regulator [Acidobacteriales bacterium]|nr:response regulator [Candidatus Koribacter versatilis]MBI3645821.1 response regulator [Terriglobales bacterium]
MKKLLIVDDDAALRGLIRRRLSSVYTVFDTGEPEQALALALEHKPDAILLDLRMPKFDGFELCRNFRSLSYTSNLPIFVVTGESGSYKKECESMGAAGYFEKPIDFAKLKQTLAATLDATEVKPRKILPLRIRIGLRLHGTDGRGEQFTELVATESASPEGFQFTSPRDFADGSVVDVFLTGSTERHVGHARVVERFSADLRLQAYRVVFDDATDWVLQKN